MSRSKNETKERRGKIGCIVAISVPILLIGGYYLWTLHVVNQLGESLKKTTEKIIKKQANKRLTKDKELIYKEILGNNQRAIFTGIETRNDTTFTNALQIKSRDSSSIEYRIESLVNWKPRDNKSGIAILDESSIGSEKWKIEIKNGVFKSAFRFVENKNDCTIEILISKRNYKTSTSIVKETCNDKSKLITTKMRYK